MPTTLDQASLDSFLGSLPYPVDQAILRHQAQIRHVSPEVLQAIQQLPMRAFRSEDEVLDALKEQGYRIG